MVNKPKVGCAVVMALVFGIIEPSSMKTDGNVTWRSVKDEILITMDVRKVSIRNLINEIGEIVKINVVFHPDADGEVSARLHDVPWREAVETLLKSNLLYLELDGTVMMIFPITEKPR